MRSFGGRETAIKLYAHVRAMTPAEIGVRTEVGELDPERNVLGLRVTYTHETGVPLELLVMALADG